MQEKTRTPMLAIVLLLVLLITTILLLIIILLLNVKTCPGKVLCDASCGGRDALWIIKDQALLSVKDHKPVKGFSLSATEFSGDLPSFFGDSKNIHHLFQFLRINWGAKIIRVPVCLSKYDLDENYSDYISYLVSSLIQNNLIAIIDAHVWRKEWTLDPTGTCPSNDQPGIDIDTLVKNPNLFQNIKSVWGKIASRFKDAPNVFFELFNEPRFEASYTDPKEMNWKSWFDIMYGLATTVRARAPRNVVLVGGLNWSYTFFVDKQNTSFINDFHSNLDNLYMPFTTLGNVVFNVHPYQHATCCGTVTDEAGKDVSLTDPYYNTYCSYYFDKEKQQPMFFDYATWASRGPSDYVPTQLYPLDRKTGKQIRCSGPGLSSSDQDKLPPCRWVDYKIKQDQTGFCSGDANVCSAYTNKNDCDANQIPAGWDKNLFMQKYGPLFMSEFGTYDCSTPFVKQLLTWAEKNKVGWTAWALWPGDGGGPGTSGNCGFPSVIRETPHQNLDCQGNCSQTLKPLGKYGELILSFLRGKTQASHRL